MIFNIDLKAAPLRIQLVSMWHHTLQNDNHTLELVSRGPGKVPPASTVLYIQFDVSEMLIQDGDKKTDLRENPSGAMTLFIIGRFTTGLDDAAISSSDTLRIQITRGRCCIIRTETRRRTLTGTNTDGHFIMDV